MDVLCVAVQKITTAQPQKNYLANFHIQAVHLEDCLGDVIIALAQIFAALLVGHHGESHIFGRIFAHFQVAEVDVSLDEVSFPGFVALVVGRVTTFCVVALLVL